VRIEQAQAPWALLAVCAFASASIAGESAHSRRAYGFAGAGGTWIRLRCARPQKLPPARPLETVLGPPALLLEPRPSIGVSEASGTGLLSGQIARYRRHATELIHFLPAHCHQPPGACQAIGFGRVL